MFQRYRSFRTSARLVILYALLLPILLPAASGEVQTLNVQGTRFQASLETEQAVVTLGEPVRAILRIESLDGAQFGYSRAATDWQFRFTAVHESGAVAASRSLRPLPDEMFWTANVKPEKGATETLNVTNVCSLDQPGTYKIICQTQLELSGASFPGTDWIKSVPCELAIAFDVELREPTPEQARELLGRSLAPDSAAETPSDPQIPNYFYVSPPDLKNRPPLHTFTAAVYFPLLIEAAQQGNPKALWALAAVARPEATRALLDFAAQALDRDDPFIARSLLHAVSQRWPYAGRSIDPQQQAEAEEYARRCWLPEFDAPARALAARFCSSADPYDRTMGLIALAEIGTQEELPLILATSQRALEAPLPEEHPGEKGDFSREISACMGAMQAAMRRGAIAPAEPQSLSETMLFLVEVRRNPGFRPEGWLQRVQAARHVANPSLQVLARYAEDFPEKIAR